MAKKNSDAADAPSADETTDLLASLPETFRGKQGAELLAEACEMYGIDPDPSTEPRELAGWHYYAATTFPKAPARITLVTCGGRKLSHPMDEATLEQLRYQVFGLVRQNKATGEITFLPLPDDLTLPGVARHGYGNTTDHIYKGGYLNNGGAEEAARRQAVREKTQRFVG